MGMSGMKPCQGGRVGLGGRGGLSFASGEDEVQRWYSQYFKSVLSVGISVHVINKRSSTPVPCTSSSTQSTPSLSRSSRHLKRRGSTPNPRASTSSRAVSPVCMRYTSGRACVLRSRESRVRLACLVRLLHVSHHARLLIPVLTPYSPPALHAFYGVPFLSVDPLNRLCDFGDLTVVRRAAELRAKRRRRCVAVGERVGEEGVLLRGLERLPPLECGQCGGAERRAPRPVARRVEPTGADLCHARTRSHRIGPCAEFRCTAWGSALCVCGP